MGSDQEEAFLPPYTIENGLAAAKAMGDFGMPAVAYLTATKMVVDELRRLRPDLDRSLFQVIEQGYQELLKTVMFGNDHQIFKKAKRPGRPIDPYRDLHIAACVTAVELLRDAGVEEPERKVAEFAVRLPGIGEIDGGLVRNWSRRIRSEMPAAEEIRRALVAHCRIRMSRAMSAEAVVKELFDTSSEHCCGGEDFFSGAIIVGLQHANRKAFQRRRFKNP